MSSNKPPLARRRAPRTCASVFLALCIVFLVWLASGPSDDDDGGAETTDRGDGAAGAAAAAAADGTRDDTILSDVHDDLLHHGQGGEGAAHAHRRRHHSHHHHHHHHGGGYLGKVREVAEDAFDSAEETFRHFVMDVATHNKMHPEDEVVDDHRQYEHRGLENNNDEGGAVVKDEDRRVDAGVGVTPGDSEAAGAAAKSTQAALQELRRKVEVLEGEREGRHEEREHTTTT